MTSRYINILQIILLTSFVFFSSCDTLIDEESELNGQTMFWSNFDGPPIDVFIDGDFYGTITTYFTEVPTCETPGCVTVELPAGSYDFYATEQSNGTNQPRDWENFFTVRANACGTILLTP